MIKIVAAVSGAWLLGGAVLLLPGIASVPPTTPTGRMAPTGAMTTGPMAPTGATTTVPMAPTGAMTTVPMAPTGAMTTGPMAPTGATTTVPMAPAAPTGAMPTVPMAATGATAPTGAMTVNSLAKGDRLDIRSYGPGCSDRGWPYYEASCIRNANAANRAAKPVRIIPIDRLPPGIELAPSR
jgi:hypothetical protein